MGSFQSSGCISPVNVCIFFQSGVERRLTKPKEMNLECLYFPICGGKVQFRMTVFGQISEASSIKTPRKGGFLGAITGGSEMTVFFDCVFIGG